MMESSDEKSDSMTNEETMQGILDRQIEVLKNQARMGEILEEVREHLRKLNGDVAKVVKFSIEHPLECDAKRQVDGLKQSIDLEKGVARARDKESQKWQKRMARFAYVAILILIGVVLGRPKLLLDVLKPLIGLLGGGG